jgi:integrase
LEKIPACQWAVKACSRQLEDLEKAKRAEFPRTFDHKKASRICRFIEMLPHIRGEWAKSGSRIELQPWQVFVFCNPETGTGWSDAHKSWDAARKAVGHPWLRVRDLRPAFATEAADQGTPMHFIQSALAHGSVAVTEKYYAKYAPEAAANQLLQLGYVGKLGAEHSFCPFVQEGRFLAVQAV